MERTLFLLVRGVQPSGSSRSCLQQNYGIRLSSPLEGQTGPTAHLPLLSLKHQHKSQGQADSGQGGKQHTCPWAAQGKHLAGGVDVGPHHHIEHL